MIMAEHETQEDAFDDLMARLGRLGYVTHWFGDDRWGPDYVAAVRNYRGLADVVVLHSDTTACAYRVPTGPGRDVFEPTEVVWLYVGLPTMAVRALMDQLPPPGHPDAPTRLFAMPGGFGIPQHARSHERVRGWGS